ncbi:peptidase M16 [Glutamicibacter uratoxydans]|uniref:Peptidase M16 n=1 Tax=Glutamicibacter uratoxydans TaxID=43667 RepID=A0A4Y4DT89_GLUUR|nr:insulinase family protein [Glutamicibacter uratoxydans]GED07883.1 peptidase M16 [Glutamicibacter uratoxydans]
MLKAKDSLGQDSLSKTLPQGTQLISISDPRALTTTVVLAFPSGMRDELPGEEGFMHLLEHMVYQDSQRCSSKEREQAIQSTGGVLGGHTHMNYTEFYETGLPHHLEAMVDRLVEQVFNPSLNEQQILDQIAAVATERRQRLSQAPGEILPWPHMLPQVWADFAHSHDGSGDEGLQGKAEADTLRRIHATRYRSSEAVLVASGPSAAETMMKVLEQAEIPIQQPQPARSEQGSALFRGSSARRIGLPNVKQKRVISVAPMSDSAGISEQLLGETICASMLSLLNGVDASAGMFGAGDMTTNDLFVLIEDGPAGLGAEARIQALKFADATLTARAVQRAIFTVEKQIHNDESHARSIARDVLLRQDTAFVRSFYDALKALGEQPAQARALVEKTSESLLNRSWHVLELLPSQEEQ